MLCPACLAFETNTDAVSVVNGTQYCALHAVQALSLSASQGRGRPGPGPGGPMGANFVAFSMFTPPPGATPPAPPA